MADPTLKEKIVILSVEEADDDFKLYSWNINIRDDQLRWLIIQNGTVWLRIKSLNEWDSTIREA